MTATTRTRTGSDGGRVRPAALRVACLCWLVAVAAGVAEAFVQVPLAVAEDGASAGLAVGLAVRALVYAAVVAVVVSLWRGHRWPRPVLTVGLGVVGVLSLVVEPIRWLTSGGDLGALLAGADVTFAAIAALRTVHVGVVLVAFAAMWSPAVTAYLRPAR